jgi:uncharacterized protein YjiS (DUF1127 family)
MTILSLRGKLGLSAATAAGERRDKSVAWGYGWRRTIARWIARSRQRQALREIAEANDFHLLKDIGVSQQDAFREAEKPFWRP